MFTGIIQAQGSIKEIRSSNKGAVFIFNSKYTTQTDAADVLNEFGASKVLMLDGGGSTQLICDGQSLVTSSRKVPQTIGVISGGGVNPEVEYFIDKCINKYSNYLNLKKD